jgi:hypothetical protein
MNIERPTSNVEWKKMKKQIYDLEERLLEYSVRIIKIVEQLPNTRTVIECADFAIVALATTAESVLDVCFFIRCWNNLRSGATSLFDVQRSMFDVGR